MIERNMVIMTEWFMTRFDNGRSDESHTGSGREIIGPAHCDVGHSRAMTVHGW